MDTVTEARKTADEAAPLLNVQVILNTHFHGRFRWAEVLVTSLFPPARTRSAHSCRAYREGGTCPLNARSSQT